MRETLSKLNSAPTAVPASPVEVENLYRDYTQIKQQSLSQSATIQELVERFGIVQDENTHLRKKREDLEMRLHALEREYEELLNKTIEEEAQTGDVSELCDLKVFYYSFVAVLTM